MVSLRSAGNHALGTAACLESLDTAQHDLVSILDLVLNPAYLADSNASRSLSFNVRRTLDWPLVPQQSRSFRKGV